ncbi:MAG: AIR synthase related protein [bacterium]
MANEESLLRQLQAILGPGLLRSSSLADPPWSDDVAILNGAGLADDTEWAITQDMLVEDVDFRRPAFGPKDIGYKALQVNLSDLAAKITITPRFAFVAVAVKPDEADTVLPLLYEGIAQAAFSAPGLVIAGGDLSSTDGPLTISITLLGNGPRGKSWRRSTAQPGDVLWISRPVGWARL